ncbi:hypothetical protein I9G03_000068 [Vibrio parahaemolyticus]|nr:hypothetical protein [Vibrio parahaemolyticus]
MQVIEQINDEKLRHQFEQQERDRARETALQQERDAQERLNKLERSYSSFHAPKNYKEKAHRNQKLSSLPMSAKSVGSTSICRKCMNIGKPRKMGRLTVCSRCGHEID